MHTIENNLPNEARVWVYQSNKKFNAEEAIVIQNEINGFVKEWTSHKTEVEGDGKLVYDRFVVLMADEDVVKLGGCSIDSSVRFIKYLGEKFNANFFDRWNIAYKKEEEVFSCSRNEFEKLLAEEFITDSTLVFNNLIQTKKDFLIKWEIPYAQSWLKDIAAAHTSFDSVL